MSRDPHYEGVGFAGLQVAELQGIIAHAKEKQQECLGLILSAVGENSPIWSAQSAVAYMSAVGEKLTELQGICEATIGALNEYGSNF